MASIIIVESNDGVRELLVDFFSNPFYGGHQVTTFTSAEKAESFLSGGNPTPDIAIVANRLPKKRGAEFIPELKRNHPSVAVIFISGLWEKAVIPGITAFFRKPLNLKEMLATVKRIMALKRRHAP